MEDVKKELMFCCKGEMLTLEEVKKRKIVSISINYLSEEREELVPGIKGLFGKKELVQDARELVINDDEGISIFFENGCPSVSINFSKKEEWDKISDYDNNTLIKRYLATVNNPFQLSFVMANLKSISWI